MKTSQNKLSVVVADPRGYSPPYDYSLCNALAQNDCDVLLACTELGPVVWNLKAEFPVWNRFYESSPDRASKGARIVHRRLAEGIDHLLGLRRFVSLLGKLDPDVVHFQWLPLPLVDQLCLAPLKRRAALVLTLHNTTLFHGVVSKWRGLGYRSALKQFDAVIVHTEFSKRRLLERGWLDESKLHVVPHGVLQYYRDLSCNPGEQGAKKNLLFFGSLHPYKGVDVLLRAFARLSPTTGRDLRLTIAGRPEMDVEPLRQLARELGIDSRVQWMLRPIAESEVPELFRRSTAVVLPYREIDQSGVLMTAIAFGKAVLATRVGGIPEIIQDGVHGYLVAPEDVQGLALAADRLLSSGERRQKMEEEVRSLLNGPLAWTSVAQRTRDIYQQILALRCKAEFSHQQRAFTH